MMRMHFHLCLKIAIAFSSHILRKPNMALHVDMYAYPGCMHVFTR